MEETGKGEVSLGTGQDDEVGDSDIFSRLSSLDSSWGGRSLKGCQHRSSMAGPWFRDIPVNSGFRAGDSRSARDLRPTL